MARMVETLPGGSLLSCGDSDEVGFTTSVDTVLEDVSSASEDVIHPLSHYAV